MLLTYLLCAWVAATAPAAPLFDRFAWAPSEPLLDEVRMACMRQQLSADVFYPHLEKLRRSASLLAIRSAIALHDHCAKEDSKRDLAALIGVDYLARKPGQVIEALLLEHAFDETLEAIAASPGMVEESPFVDCGQNCVKAVDPFFDHKMQAVKGAPAEGSAGKAVKQKLLAAIEKARKSWRRRLSPVRQ